MNEYRDNLIAEYADELHAARAERDQARQSDWQRQHPHGLSPKNPHIVHPAAKERGGWAVCASCYQPVYIERTEANDAA